MIQKEFIDGCFNLVRSYRKRYDEQPHETLEMFCYTSIPMESLYNIYEFLATQNMVVRINNLKQSIKDEIWCKAKSAQSDISKEKGDYKLAFGI